MIKHFSRGDYIDVGIKRLVELCVKRITIFHVPSFLLFPFFITAFNVAIISPFLVHF
ncbi:hypothetical protein C7379_1521 [Hallella colorans]|uniref:Uncharacterized protein n=1 Tax=Hallella colorans TaxID=1703337 RepID=A0A2U0TI93_9BACT|nr:hypothetical protein C7379_1521 [Hallella colorans]